MLKSNAHEGTPIYLWGRLAARSDMCRSTLSLEIVLGFSLQDRWYSQKADFNSRTASRNLRGGILFRLLPD